ncbi:10897_t:CDS:2 [Entrophospora sp. SA101]|nr:10897_t:CDS:2 [Entrophospora sp. SA101]
MSIGTREENLSLHYKTKFRLDNNRIKISLKRKDKAHQAFFNTLHNINNDLRMPKEVRDIAEKIRGIGVTLTLASTELDAFIGFALADINKVNNSLWNKINKNKKKSPPPPLSLSSVMRKKRSAHRTYRTYLEAILNDLKLLEPRDGETARELAEEALKKFKI